MCTLPEYYDQKLTILKQPIYNFGQNILDKSTKLGFSMEYFTAEFLQFWRTAVKIFFWVAGWLLFFQFQAFQRFL